MPSKKDDDLPIIVKGAVIVVFVTGICTILVVSCYGLFLLGNFTLNEFSAAQNQEPAHGTETAHVNPEERENQAEAVNAHASPIPETEADEQDAMIEVVVTRLLEKLRRGEITLQPGNSCSGDAGKQGGWSGSEAGEVKVTHVTNVTQVTNVTRVTRLQYQCLLSDEIRWRLLENDLKKAVVEEMEAKLADMRAETDSKMETLALKTSENRRAREEHSHRLDDINIHLEELERQLALEPQFMEIRGFMKIDSFGPVLLLMGALHMIEILLVCFLFAWLQLR